MKIVKPVKTLDPTLLLQLASYAKSEFGRDAQAFKKLESSSLGMWELWNKDKFLGYAGVSTENFLAPPVFWLLAAELTSYSDVKIFKVLSNHLHEAFPKVVTFVEASWEKGAAFARFCGFVPTYSGFEAYGVEYVKYVRGE